MRRMSVVDRYVVGRHDNVFHVDFGHEPDPPTTPFPGAGSLRFAPVSSDRSDALAHDCANVPSTATAMRRM